MTAKPSTITWDRDQTPKTRTPYQMQVVPLK